MAKSKKNQHQVQNVLIAIEIGEQKKIQEIGIATMTLLTMYFEDGYAEIAIWQNMIIDSVLVNQFYYRLYRNNYNYTLPPIFVL